LGGIIIQKRLTAEQKRELLNCGNLPHLSIFDNINQIAYVADPKTYEILFVNKYFEGLLGKNPVGKKCYEVFQKVKHPCDFCTNKKILKNKDKSYEWEYHNSVLNKDYMITDRIIKWHDGRDVRFEFAIDITKTKLMDDEIKSIARFPSENPSPVFRTDKNGVILYANDACKSVLTDWSCCKGKKVPDKIQKLISQTLKSNKIKEIEIKSKNKIFLFKIVPIFDSSYVNFYASDITDVIIAEKKIQQSEERFRLAQKAAEIGSWDWNILSDDLEWSETIEPMFGFKKDKFGKTYEAFLDCIHPDDRPFVIDSINACIEKDEEYDIEHRIIWPNGSVHWVRETGDVIRDKDGKPVRMLGIVQEITNRKKNEEQIKKLNESLWQYTIRLEAANKEIEAFSYSVSHDLRAPLRSIDGFSQALIEDYANKLDGTGLDYLKRVRNASQRMGQLIDGMLQLSRLSRKEMHIENVDMAELAMNIIKKFKKEDPSRNVDFKVQDDLVTRGDKNLLQILLENLLGNAWKFSSKRSNAKIEFGKTKKKNEVVFFIKDNGSGFDMKYADKLFVPFQRLHDAEFPGDGIGLGIVSRVIRRHGGRIWADGEVGKGAIFHFKLGGKKYE
jgi:PAS domain S-box-containing protein